MRPRNRNCSVDPVRLDSIQPFSLVYWFVLYINVCDQHIDISLSSSCMARTILNGTYIRTFERNFRKVSKVFPVVEFKYVFINGVLTTSAEGFLFLFLAVTIFCFFFFFYSALPRKFSLNAKINAIIKIFDLLRCYIVVYEPVIINYVTSLNDR